MSYKPYSVNKEWSNNDFAITTFITLSKRDYCLKMAED